jgi:type VI secretion system secreted protein VgrG
VLSGIHSQNFDGSGFNQWQLDDTRGQLRMRLATSTASTELNLGYLVDQQPGSAARGRYRGSGFELRTDAWAVLRGGEGVLLSTRARPSLGSGVTSTQMDVAEAVSQMKAAQSLSETLGGAAAQQQALFSKDAAQAQAELVQQLDPNAGGKYAGTVNGQQGLKAKSGRRELDVGQHVEKFASSSVLLDSSANINWATPASTVICAGKQLHWTTSSDLHYAAAYTVSSVSGIAAGLFTRTGGILAIAANGPVSLQAHTDQMELLSDAEVTVISVNDSIHVNAKEKIVLQAAQCSVTLDGGNIIFTCPGSFASKAGQHVFDKGEQSQAELPHLPDTTSRISNFIALHYRDADGEPMAGVPYKIKFEGGVVIKGKLDGNGSARHENVPDKPISAEYEERDPLPDKPWNPLAEMLAKANAMFGNQP